MAPAIIEARESFHQYEALPPPQPSILFNPKEIQQRVGELRLAEYQMEESELLQWGERTTRLRATID